MDIKIINAFTKYTPGAINLTIEDLKELKLIIPDIRRIVFRNSIKHIYGEESFIFEYRSMPVLRIVGDRKSGFRIVTPTTSESGMLPGTTIQRLLQVSSLFCNIFGLTVLELEDRMGRPFNVLGEFIRHPRDIASELNEFVWIFLLIFSNENFFEDTLISNNVFKNLGIMPSTKLRKNEFRRGSSSSDFWSDLYKEICENDPNIEGRANYKRDVYLGNGDWLTHEGRILEKKKVEK